MRSAAILYNVKTHNLGLKYNVAARHILQLESEIVIKFIYIVI